MRLVFPTLGDDKPITYPESPRMMILNSYFFLLDIFKKTAEKLKVFLVFKTDLIPYDREYTEYEDLKKISYNNHRMTCQYEAWSNLLRTQFKNRG
jgi:hypothetical protein